MPRVSSPANSDYAEYPMIPIRDVIIFPHTRVAFKIGRPRSMAALRIANKGNRRVFVVTQHDSEVEKPLRDDVYDVGTVVELETVEMTAEPYRVVVKGLTRASLVKIVNRKLATFAVVSPIPKISESDKPVSQVMQHVGRLIQEALSTIAEPTRNLLRDKLNTSSPSLLSDSIASLLPLVSLEDKQKLLETTSPFERLLRIASLLESKEISFQLTKGKGSSIFIGHGRSPLWARLQLFLQNDLGLTTLNYETESRVGDSIVPILERMLDESGFAVLVLTAEDQSEHGKRARQNVIHEAGLFQGRLGFRKAILLVQDGIEDFSNIAGLQHIRFSGDRIDQTFYELQRVLKREGLMSDTL